MAGQAMSLVHEHPVTLVITTDVPSLVLSYLKGP